MNQTVQPVVTTRNPARDPALPSDVGVPVAWALVWGGGTALVASIVAWRIGWDVPTVGIMAGGFGFFVGLFAEKWLSLQTRWRIERATGFELTHDNVRGEPPNWVESNNPPPPSPKDVEWQRLSAFVEHAYAKNTTAIIPARRAGFTDDEWGRFKSILERARVTKATRRGDTAGWLLTPPSAAACLHEVQGSGFFM